MPRVCQANAEPDVAQTGSRLRPLVAGLVEGVLALVADPLARAVRTSRWHALLVLSLALHEVAACPTCVPGTYKILCTVRKGCVLQAGAENACSARSADGLQEAGEEGHMSNGAHTKCDSNAESAPDALLLGHWGKLWDRRQPGRDMASGMRMM